MAPYDSLWSPPPAELGAAVVLGAATLALLVNHLATAPAAVRALYPEVRARLGDGDALSTRTAWHRKLFGGPWLLAVALVVGQALSLPLGLGLDRLEVSLLWVGVPYAALVPVLIVQSRKAAFQALYPEVRTPFTPRTRLRNAGAWLVFLVGYELFFRGLLVLGLATLIGPWPALAASLVPYVAVHLHKYPGEAVGSVFTGVGFSLVALETHSLLMPILLHWLMAVTSDELAARARAKAAP